MARRSTAHDLANYARCPRAWWYERYQALACLDREALEEALAYRRAALGRRATHDPECKMIIRLLQRQDRFTHGRLVHLAAARNLPRPRAFGCLFPAALLLLALVLAMLWR